MNLSHGELESPAAERREDPVARPRLHSCPGALGRSSNLCRTTQGPWHADATGPPTRVLQLAPDYSGLGYARALPLALHAQRTHVARHQAGSGGRLRRVVNGSCASVYDHPPCGAPTREIVLYTLSHLVKTMHGVRPRLNSIICRLHIQTPTRLTVASII